MIYLLDTSAVLVHYRQEPGFDQVLRLFDNPDHTMLLSSVSLAEFGRVMRSAGLSPTQVDATLDSYLLLFAEIVPVDARIARASLHLITAVPTRIPTVDSLIAASAQERSACLVHRDAHFAAIPPDLLPMIDLAAP